MPENNNSQPSLPPPEKLPLPKAPRASKNDKMAGFLNAALVALRRASQNAAGTPDNADLIEIIRILQRMKNRRERERINVDDDK